ncbi:MAG: adenylate/guanylate cyclase domain-containing protein [Deltaproteobacteria bacterium]|nr:MAG: adenylate/guanylate cyclase domain-containing protein [Deltaproteobacteria bacterium]
MQFPGPLVGALALAALGLGYALWRSRQERSRLRRALEAKSADLEHLQLSFSRFAPEEVVESVIASGVTTHGERKEVTALFADLVGFTALSESLEPSVLVRILNGYFERMSQAITDHRGHVSNLVGDGILALFGALQPNPWQGNDALHAALAMREELSAYNRELEQEGLPTLSIGVGLHRGWGVAGLVGSRDLMQFAFVGRIVNLAARVQDLTRQYRVDILLTDAVRKTLDPRFKLRELPATPVRGVAEPVVIFAAESFEA